MSLVSTFESTKRTAAINNQPQSHILKTATMQGKAAADHVDVLIVGAGPAGLMMATWLAKCGIKTRIVDKRGTKVSFECLQSEPPSRSFWIRSSTVRPTVYNAVPWRYLIHLALAIEPGSSQTTCWRFASGTPTRMVSFNGPHASPILFPESADSSRSCCTKAESNVSFSMP